MEEIVALCKRRGFIYPTSEIYGGLANSYDYGPLGTELLHNIRNIWWKEFIHKRPDMVGLDSQIIQHTQTWVASGHVSSFADPLVEDKVSHKRYRADHLIEEWIKSQKDQTPYESIVVEDMNIDEMADFIVKHKIRTPEGNEVSEPKTFNLLFETAIGAVAGEKSKVYLRGETAQGIFTNFQQVVNSTRVQIPFGIGNIGKSFRNEITTGQFIFRTIEFEQAEIEYFFDPEEQDWKKLLEDWKESMWSFVTKRLGVQAKNLRWRQHTDKERSFYSKETYDLDYNFSFGWKELWGIAYRTDYDLKQHQTFSKVNLQYTDPRSGKKYIPHVIEPAVGVNRLLLMVLADAFEKEDNGRVVLKLLPTLAPYKVAVFPLVKNKPLLVKKAQEVYQKLSNEMSVAWDDRGNIGKRYMYQDEIGTPFCVTIDYDTIESGTVTVRDRDSMKQDTIPLSDLDSYLHSRLFINS